MFRKTYLGLEVRREGLRAIAVNRRGARVALCGGQTLAFGDGVLNPVARELNICKAEQFVDAIREVLFPLANGENRVAVALPDSSGHIFLLEVDTPFKKRSEGLEIIRWKLKDLLPGTVNNTAVDYQILEERESGSKRVLASVMAKNVLLQYEELLAEAGFAAALVDFHALNFYNAYRSRIDLGSDYILVGVDSQQLCLLGFENKLLNFHRVKTVTEDPASIFHEINRSMVSYRRAHPGSSRAKVYLHTNWQQQDELLEAVTAAFDREIKLLPSPLDQLIDADRLAVSAADSRSMAAALGVAERMIQRVG